MRNGATAIFAGLVLIACVRDAGAMDQPAEVALDLGPFNVDTPSLPSPGRRVVVDAHHAPWRAIGRLNRAGQGFCTAFLVRPDWIATAAHCLWNRDIDRFFEPSDLHFLAGYQRERYEAHARGRKLVVNPKFRPRRGPEPENVANDWAFVQLDRPIGHDLGYLKMAQMTAGQLLNSAGEAKNGKTRFAQAGYSKDFRYVITANRDCRLGRVANLDLIAHNCEVLKGDSGSPILTMSDNSVRVIALHVATGEQDGRRFGLAVPAGSFGKAGLTPAP